VSTLGHDHIVLGLSHLLSHLLGHLLGHGIRDLESDALFDLGLFGGRLVALAQAVHALDGGSVARRKRERDPADGRRAEALDVRAVLDHVVVLVANDKLKEWHLLSDASILSAVVPASAGTTTAEEVRTYLSEKTTCTVVHSRRLSYS